MARSPSHERPIRFETLDRGASADEPEHTLAAYLEDERPATAHEGHALVTRVSAPTGVRVSTYTDVLGRVTKVTNNVTAGPDGAPVLSHDPSFERTVETREYENNNSKVTVTDARGMTTVSTSDVFGRPLLGTLKNGHTALRASSLSRA